MIINGLPLEVVLKTHKAYSRLEKAWRIIEDATTIITPSVIRRYITRSPNESDKTYEQRCETAYRYFHSGVNDNIVKTMGIIGNIHYDDDVCESFKAAAQLDIDGLGNDLKTYFSFSLRQALLHGWTFHLVDFPPIEPGENLLSYRQKRPHLINIPAPAVINWNYNRKLQSFDLIVIKEDSTIYVQEEGKYCEKIKENYRILVPGLYYLITKKDDGFEVIEEGETGLNFIPISLQLGNANMSSSILEELTPAFYHTALQCFDLVDLTSQVRRNLLDHNLPIKMIVLPQGRVADPKAPNPFLYGNDKALVIEHGGHAAIIEPSGNALAISLDMIEKQRSEIIETLNGISLVSSSGNIPVVEALFRADSIVSMIDSVVRSLISCYDNILRYWCIYTGETWKGGSFSLPKADNKLPMQADIANLLLTLQDRQLLSDETILKLLKEGRILPENFCVESELDKLENALTVPEPDLNGGDFYNLSEVESDGD
jgi:hypothetical protein